MKKPSMLRSALSLLCDERSAASD